MSEMKISAETTRRATEEVVRPVVDDFFSETTRVLGLAGDLADYKGESPLVSVIRNRVIQVREDLFSSPDQKDVEGIGKKAAAKQLLDDGEKETGALSEQIGNRILREHLSMQYREDIESILAKVYEATEVQDKLKPLFARFSEVGLISSETNDMPDMVFTSKSFVDAFWAVLDIGYSRAYLGSLNTEAAILEKEGILRSFYGVIVKEVFQPNQDKLPNLRHLYNGIIHTYNRALDGDFPEIAEHRNLILTRGVMQQVREKADIQHSRLTTFLGLFSADYIEDHGRSLADIYFGVERVNLTDAALAEILQNSHIDFVEYFCPPWQWHEEDRDKVKPLTNFSIEPKEPERRAHRLNNLADFLSVVSGSVEVLPADVQIQVVWRETNRDKHEPNILSHLRDVQSKIARANLGEREKFGLLTQWLEEGGRENFDKNYTNFIFALAMIYEKVDDLDKLELTREDLVPDEFFNDAINVDQSEVLEFVRWLKGCSVSREWLERFVQNEYETKVRFTNIDKKDALSYTLREMAMEVSTYLEFAKRKRIDIEEYDSLDVSSPYTLLATRLSKDIKLIVIPRSRSILENAQLRLAGEIRSAWLMKK